MFDEAHVPATDLPDRIDPASHAFFLDFDGTLAPIVARPTDVSLPAPTRALVGRLIAAAGGAVAVLTGRALDDVAQHLDGLELVVAGSHGLELRRPGEAPQTLADTTSLDRTTRTLTPLAETHGLLLERKPGAVALHYRGRPEMEKTCRAAVDDIAAADATLRALHGNMVSEVAPAGTGKGRALETLMQQAPFRGRMPVMIGDDVTDEDGFRAAQDLGGIAIKIGPGPTSARHRARDMNGALDWLAAVAGQEDQWNSA